MSTSTEERLPESMFQQKLGQIQKHPTSADQLRLIRNVADNYEVSAKQAADMILVFSYFEDMAKAAEFLFPKIYDPENLSDEIMPRLHYDEDKIGLGEALGIEIKCLKEKPVPKQVNEDPKFSGHAWIS